MSGTLATVLKSVKSTIDTVGLGGPARSALNAYHRQRLGVRQALWNRSIALPPLVDAERFQACAENAIRELERRGHDFGDYFEFGVSRGTSLAAMHRATEATGHADMHLVGFDSFEGLPPEAEGQGWKPGEFRSPIGATWRYLRRQGVDPGRTTLVKGWFRDTLTPDTVRDHHLGTVSLVMIDCDIYSAAREALDFCGPRIGRQAVIFFDDWGWSVERGERGEREAFGEFLEGHGPFEAETLPAYFDKARVFIVSRV